MKHAFAQPNVMKHAFTTILPVLALTATAAAADDAAPAAALPELPDAPVLEPARPAPKAALPKLPAAPVLQPAAPAKPVATTQPNSTEIDLSDAKVVTAETDDGKPVYVVFRKEESESLLLRDNERGGWTGNAYFKGGLGAAGSGIWDIDRDTKMDSAIAVWAEGSIPIFKGLSLRVSGLTVPSFTMNGRGYSGHIGNSWWEDRKYDDSDGSYSSLQPVLMVSLNRNGCFNPYVGIGLTMQQFEVKEVFGINNGWYSSPYDGVVEQTTGDIKADETYPMAVAGLEINAGRIRLDGEAILVADEEKRIVNPLANYWKEGEDTTILYGLDFSADILLAEQLSFFAEAKLVGSFRVFGAGIGWRF